MVPGICVFFRFGNKSFLDCSLVLFMIISWVGLFTVQNQTTVRVRWTVSRKKFKQGTKKILVLDQVVVWRWKSKFYVIFRFFCFVVSHMNIYACKEDISCRNKGVFKTYVEREIKRPSLRAAPRALLFCGPAFAPSPSAS